MTDYVPPDWLEREEEVLAPYGMRTRESRGRRHPEPDHPYRTAYQRDRDRIVHSTAFRRLMHKTQVLAYHSGDHHRTRLTHTLEVTQIGRTVARQLGLNEDLVEAIALLHDLGHPPFGHAGEEALDDCMAGAGGFEHNRHGLRIVEDLEYRYADFPGLNLTWEVLEAQAYHSKRQETPEVRKFLGKGRPTLEAQVVDAADSLAYDTHDIDDALSLGLLTPAELAEVPFWSRTVERVLRVRPGIGTLQFQPAVVRALIDWQVGDLLEQTRRNLRDQAIGSVEAVRSAPDLLVAPSREVEALKLELEEFLRQRVYRHHRVLRMAQKGKRIVVGMFEEFVRHPELLPDRYRARVEVQGRERVVCDYIAGMTDRFAREEYLRLFQPDTPP